jgi:hypothetical protein
MHPLMPDVTGLKDSELQERITKLNRVLRTTYNGLVAQQAQMMLTVLYEEQQRRNREIMEKAVKDNKKLSDSIDIS